jgi:hypothetical protein
MRSKQDNSKYDFYRRTGATPPSVDEHGTEQELEQLRKQSGEHVHKWVQKGPYIECSQGPIIHGSATPSINHILVGTSSDGAPLWRNLTDAPQSD